jgi:hypothetical protein
LSDNEVKKQFIKEHTELFPQLKRLTKDVNISSKEESKDQTYQIDLSEFKDFKSKLIVETQGDTAEGDEDLVVQVTSDKT